ncbi:helix-turn-helix transcriptional regulator [Streptomyces fuscichromogenes]|uniref:HTH luxR-type domain-containing protein n=1 Tax=Streptomyces fuscichromogenes TaxID=1324013 RepID=A0A917XQB0_9ACTN|nr:LuxR family transcriptional regulator [Streptomyces fuscichromogenes]GGN45914.1 hypothetical protein GCM10011578_098330 [Streptomyces fuscichromogenes]
MPQWHVGPQDRAARQSVHAAELAVLLEELRLAHGGSRTVALSGEPWIGKTRLARLLARQAARQDWAVAWGQPARDGAPYPFHPLVDALDDWAAAAAPAALERLGAGRVRVLARLLPALGGDAETARGLDAHAVPRVLRALLEVVAGPGGLLLVLDDAHRAGPEMAWFAEELVRRPPSAAVLTVLVHRSGPAARELTRIADEDDAVRRVVLRPLPRAAAGQLLPAGLDPLSRELALRDAAGVPGLLRALATAAGPPRDGLPPPGPPDAERPTQAPAPSARPPREPGAPARTAARAVRPAPGGGAAAQDARDGGAAAGVQGGEPPVPAGGPHGLGGLPPAWGGGPPAQAESQAARGKEPPTQGEGPAARGKGPAVRGEEPPARGEGPAVRGEEPPTQAESQAVRREESPGRGGGQGPVVRGGESPGRGRGPVVGGRGDGGGCREVHGVFELAVGAAEWAVGAAPLDLRALSPLARRTMTAAAVVGDPFAVPAVAATAALPVADVLRAVDELHGEGVLRPCSRAGWFRFARPVVRALTYQAAGPAARHVLRERALTALREPGGHGGTAVAALLAEAEVLTGPQAALLAEQAHATVFVRPAWAARAALRVAQRPGAPLSARLLLCRARVVGGRCAEAVGEYARLWPGPGGFGPSPAVWAEAAVWRSRALRLLGARAQARRALRSGPAEERAVLAAAHAELAALLLESGPSTRGSALVAARRAVRAVPRGDVAARGHALALVAAAHAAGGEGGPAREVAGEAEPLLSGLDRWQAAPVVEAWRWLGEAALAGGDPARAGYWFGGGLDLALHHGQRSLLGRLAFGFAQSRLHSGDPVSAVFHSRFAAAEFEQLGAYAHTAASKDLEGVCEHASRRQAEANSQNILSSREREVAMLIGPGLTNQQIASRLDISVKTVETYMARIFKKMGANSRAQVAFLMSGAPTSPSAL